MFPANQRYGTIGAGAVAAFADFKIGVVLWGGLHALGLETIMVFGLQRPDELAPLVHSVEGVDLGQLFAQFLFVALDEASDGYQTAFAAAALLDGNLFKEDID